MKISKAGLDFIKGFESFVPHVYDDLRPPVNGAYKEWKGEKVKGTLTIGYGHTNAAAHPLKIKLGLRVTEEEALEILDVDLDECEDDVNELVKKPLTQGQYDALVSFTFNCGKGNLKNIARRINAGRFDDARAALDLYIKSQGKVLRGLQRRRDGEQALWDATPTVVPVEPVHHTAEVDAAPKQLPPAAVPVAGTGAGIGLGMSIANMNIPAPPANVVTSVSGWQSAGEIAMNVATSPALPWVLGGFATYLIICHGIPWAQRRFANA